jgi:hypothetical protein
MSAITSPLDDTDLNTDLQRLAALAAGPLAASHIQQTKQLTTVDTLQNASTKVGSIERPSLPTLTRPEPLDEQTFVQGKEDLKKLFPNDQNQVAGDVDDLVHQLLLNVINSSSGYLQAKRSFFESERLWNDKMEQKRIDEVEKELTKSKDVSLWQKVEKSLLSFGLIAAGIGGICSGMLPLGIAALSMGTLLALDQLLDDKMKKTVASWIARGDHEGQKTWLDRIQVFCTVVGAGLSFGLTSAAGLPALIQMAIIATNALVSTTKGVLGYRLNVQRAILIELDAACRTAQTSVDRLIQEIHESCNTLYQLHENISHVSEQRRRLINSFMQFH